MPKQRPLKRNFVHVDDLVSAILAAIDNPRARGELFNICMDEPVDYGEVASLSERDAQASGGRDSEPLPFELDGQRQGEAACSAGGRNTTSSV